MVDAFRRLQNARRLGSRHRPLLPKGDQLKYALQIHFAASNNVAEYEAPAHFLRLAKEIGIRRILCFGDSDLVVQQVTSEWDARDANMASYHFLVQQMCGSFEGCEFHHVPRADNEAADTLTKIGSSRQAIPASVSLEHLDKPSIKPSPDSKSIFIPADPGNAGSGDQPAAGPTLPGAAGSGSGPPGPVGPVEAAVLTVIEAPSWAQSILSFLVNGELPADEVAARQIQRRAPAYTIINRELVKRSISGQTRGARS